MPFTECTLRRPRPTEWYSISKTSVQCAIFSCRSCTQAICSRFTIWIVNQKTSGATTASCAQEKTRTGWSREASLLHSTVLLRSTATWWEFPLTRSLRPRDDRKNISTTEPFYPWWASLSVVGWRRARTPDIHSHYKGIDRRRRQRRGSRDLACGSKKTDPLADDHGSGRDSARIDHVSDSVLRLYSCGVAGIARPDGRPSPTRCFGRSSRIDGADKRRDRKNSSSGGPAADRGVGVLISQRAFGCDLRALPDHRNHGGALHTTRGCK